MFTWAMFISLLVVFASATPPVGPILVVAPVSYTHLTLPTKRIV